MHKYNFNSKSEQDEVKSSEISNINTDTGGEIRPHFILPVSIQRDFRDQSFQKTNSQVKEATINAAQETKYFNRICDETDYNLTGTSNVYNCGASSLPLDLNWNSQINDITDFDSELVVNDHWIEVDVQRMANQYRNVEGLELPTSSQVTKNISDPAPRERKRWVRPPLVGQAATGDSSKLRKNISCESETEDFLQPNLTGQKILSIRSIVTEDSMDVNDIHEEDGIFVDVKEALSTSQNRACGDVRECGNTMDNKDNFASARSSMIGTSFPDIQHSQISNHDSGSETVGGGRAPSPASVSSVTSSRRLEWDSGADVGYQNYQHENDDVPNGDGLSTIERIALARGCSAALRLEPEGIAGSTQQLPILPLQPATMNRISKFGFKAPVAVSTPIDKVNAPSSATGTDSEAEITPVVTLSDRFMLPDSDDAINTNHKSNFDEEGTDYTLHNEKRDIILSKKLSTSLTDLTEVQKNSLPRSQSYLSLLSKKQKAKTVTNTGSYPLRYRKNNGAMYSASSSSIATVIPKHDSPRVSDKLIQTSMLKMPRKQSIGIQVSDNSEIQTLGSFISSKCDECVTTGHLTLSRSTDEENLDSDIIDKTESSIEKSKTHTKSKYILGSRTGYLTTNDFSQTPQLQKKSEHKTRDRDLQSSYNNEKSSDLNLDVHMRGSIEQKVLHVRGQELVENSSKTSNSTNPNIINYQSKNRSSKLNHQKYAETNNSEEEMEKNSGTLDSVSSGTQTTGSWFVAELPVGNGNHRRGSSGVVGSANSFEYLPGHVYESATIPMMKRNAITEDSSSETMSSHPSTKSMNGKFISDNKVWTSSRSSSMARDLEKGVNMLKGLIHSKSFNNEAKKKLVRQVVKKLVETDYIEDNIDRHLDSNASWIPSKRMLNSVGSVSDYIAEGSSHEDMTGIQKARRPMEREEISGESASEQGLNKNNSNKTSKMSPEDVYLVADKCVGTVFSEISGQSSISERSSPAENRVDSRAETTTSISATRSSSALSTINKKVYDWKKLTTQSEKEYESRKQKSSEHSGKSILLGLCETERENQLSWIQTEIQHLHNLKQLLKKEENLRSSCDDLKFQEKINGKKHLARIQKHINSTSSSEQWSVKSDETNNTNFSGRFTNKGRETILKNAQLDKEIQKTTSRNSNKSVSEQKAHWLPHHRNPVLLPSREKLKTGIDAATLSLHGKKILSYEHKNKSRKVPSSSSTNGDTYELSKDIPSDSTFTGRINVYVQTGQKSPQISEVDNPTESNELVSQVTVKNNHLKAQNSLCCCECKRLLTKVSSEIKAKDKNGQFHIKNNKTRNKAHTTSKETKYHSSESENLNRSSSQISSGTLRDAVELSHDLEERKRVSVATDTVMNAGIQTTNSLSSLPLIRPQWYSSTAPPEIYTRTGGNQMVCPCCGAVESQSDIISDMTQEEVQWKCSRCQKMEQSSVSDKRCQKCGILESEYHKLEKSGVFDPEITWKCHDCLERESMKMTKCMHCGKEQLKNKNKAGHKSVDVHKSSNSSIGSAEITPRIAVKSSMGYILTVESSPGTATSTLERRTKSPLHEIKVKVPSVRKIPVSKERKKEINKMGSSKLEQKENKTQGINTKENTSTKDLSQMNKLLRNDLTLQEYLVKNRPDFIQSAEYRREVLDELAYLRDLRQKSRHKLLALSSHTSLLERNSSASSLKTESLPPPPLAVKRVFSQRSMRAMTERKYHNLSEVQNRKVEKKRKEDYRTNRLMAEIFARKLQRKALRGEVNLSNSRSVITI